MPAWTKRQLYFARMAMANTNVLIVGFGDIGERVARLLCAKHAIFALIRDPARAAAANACGVKPILADLCDSQSLLTLFKVTPPAKTIFYFAPPPPFGMEDIHTRNLLATFGGTTRALLPQRIVYISTTGVYGDCSGARIDETRALNPQTDRARRRVDAESKLKLWAEQNQVVLVIFRVPGIYAVDRLPTARLKAGTPAIITEEDAYTNHIHADDLAAACVAAMALNTSHILNIVDDSDMKMSDYFDLVADHFHLPRAVRISRQEAEAQIPPSLLSFMDESRRIQNVQMKEVLALRLRYPTVASFLATLR